MIRGLDLSSYQPLTDFPVIRASGAEFAIVKITEGNQTANPLADRQVGGSVTTGLLTMLYHFARPNGPDWLADAKAEAARVLALLDGYEQKYGLKIFSWLDVERNDALTLAERPLWHLWCNTYRDEFRKKTRMHGFYSYGPFTTQLALEDDWTKTLLWMAKYPNVFQRDPTKYPTWPACWPSVRPWPRADIWQDGADANKATWPGVTCSLCKGAGCDACTNGLAHTDVNCFAGSRQELEDLIDSAA
jgi:GH25 family lysozyme M1 (1,4-beta-N-acetylmuramidase)